jgi:hypothetical protein
MDPITAAIVAALAKLAEPAVTDAYNALKSAIAHKFGKEAAVARSVGQLEEKPQSPGRRETLVEEIQASGAAKDPELVSLAASITKLVGSSSGATVHQQVHGSHNIVAGTGNVTINRAAGNRNHSD